jgi:type I restriction enzyme S subunit
MSFQYKVLGDLCDFQNGFVFKSKLFKDSGLPIIRITNIQDQIISTDKLVYFDPKNYKQDFEKYKVEPNDLLIAMSGATTGKIGFNNTNKTFYLNQRVGNLKPKQVLNKKYLYYFLLTQVEKNLKKALGAAQPNLSTEQIKNLPLPFLPLPIQEKIVAKLDKSFAEIDKVIAATETNIKNIEDFFQSYLEKIYNNEHFAKKKISEIAKIKGGKRIPKGFNLKTEKTPYVYLRVKSFTESGEIDNSELRYVDAEVKNLIKNYIINSEDLYISIAGTIGRTGIVSKELSGSLLTENACRLVFEKNINNKFVYYFTKSPSFKSQLIEQTRTTAQPKLALYRLGNIKLIIPNLKQQFMIIEDVERITFFVTSNQNKYFSKINELKNLKQSILKQAFNGELVKAA